MNDTDTNVVSISSAAEAKAKSGAGGLPVELPSGLTFLVRRPGVESFVKAGIIPNSLLGVVQEALEKGKDEKAAEVELSELTKQMLSGEQVTDIMTLTDEVVERCVVQPTVHPITKREEIQAREDLKDDDKASVIASMLFIDEIVMEDKLFIFAYVTGGTADLAAFREQTAASVATVQHGDSASPKAKRPVRPKR